MEAVRMLISGKVQNAGFREFARRHASLLNVKGYAKNLANGNLEIFAQGKNSDVQKFIKHIKRGPLLADIKETKVFESQQKELSAFVVEVS